MKNLLKTSGIIVLFTVIILTITACNVKSDSSVTSSNPKTSDEYVAVSLIVNRRGEVVEFIFSNEDFSLSPKEGTSYPPQIAAAELCNYMYEKGYDLAQFQVVGDIALAIFK
jgi:hypothetical protein